MVQFGHRFLGARPYVAPPTEAYRMEDAPKDGTWIFIWGHASFGSTRSVPPDLKPTWHHAYWYHPRNEDDYEPDPEDEQIIGMWSGPEDVVVSNPIAWIPVPGPPKSPPLSWDGPPVHDEERNSVAWITY